MARIPIVDEEDTIITYKERDEIVPGDIYRVSGLWIVDGKGKALFARRALTKKKSPGLWGPSVAGTVEEGESYQENIVKEAREELGLQNLTLTPWMKKRISRPTDNFFSQWFICVYDASIESFVPDPLEVAEVKWLSLVELKSAVESSPHDFSIGMLDLVQSEPEYLNKIFSYAELR